MKKNSAWSFVRKIARRGERVSGARGRHVTVHVGEFVRAGDPLIDGSMNPHDILAVKGTKALRITW